MRTVGHNGKAVKRESVANAPGADVPCGVRDAAPGDFASPSLSFRHNCIHRVETALERVHKRSSKMPYVIRLEVERLARDYGLEKLGFLTLTFAEKVESLFEAQRRFHSLLTNVLSKHFKGGITVWERFEHGIHFHVLVVCEQDIRTGLDFGAVAAGDYRSASDYLRAMWAFLRVALPHFNFGRHELLPVRVSAEAVGKYLGKYISKHLACKLDCDSGARIVRFFGCARIGRVAGAQMMWAEGRSYVYRLGVGAFAARFGVTWEDMRRIGGPRWAFHLGETFWRMGLTVWKGGEDYVK